MRRHAQLSYVVLLRVVLAIGSWEWVGGSGIAADDASDGTNLLRNATFLQQTTPPIPDYWDLHHVSALTFKNLHDQYGVDSSIVPPVLGTRVLKVINSEDGFSHTVLMPRQFFAPLPHGPYTFSIYLKADQKGRRYQISPAWAQGTPQIGHLSREWTRYDYPVLYSGNAPDRLQPMVTLLDKGTYYIAAPQLERHGSATPFQPDHPQESSLLPAAASARDVVGKMVNALRGKSTETINASTGMMFEYDFYTDDAVARLRVAKNAVTSMSMRLRCLGVSDSRELSGQIHLDIDLPSGASVLVDVPIQQLAQGDYRCLLEGRGATGETFGEARLRKLPSNAYEVRMNHFRKILTINRMPFTMIGMGVGGWKVPPDWYFEDLALHGITTVFYTRSVQPSGRNDLHELELFLSTASRHRLKVILGIGIAGSKPPDWRERLARFNEIASAVKTNPAIIGWYPVDEPAAKTWTDDELLEVYSTIKKLDPYRPVMVNWAYDGIPLSPGQEPRGTLQCTDIYSSDYYPFAGQGRNLNGFTSVAIRTIETARLAWKSSHSWIQIYGGMDAWREPTGAEIRYMVYSNLLYGGWFSYWDTKSNSAKTWQAIGTLNQEAKVLAESLFQHPEATEVQAPKIDGNLMYSIWGKGSQLFVLLVNQSTFSQSLDLNLSSLTVNRQATAVRLFGPSSPHLTAGHLLDSIGPLDGVAYRIDLK